MLIGKIAIHYFKENDFDEIKSFCDLNDMVHGLSKTKTNV